MVKIWKADLDYGWGDGGIVDDKQGSLFEEVSLGTPPGQLIPGEFSNLKMKLSTEPPKISLDFFYCGTMLLVSEGLKAVLEEAAANIQYFPFEIKHAGKTLSGRTFFYCHILDYVDCLDFKRGEYIFWEEEDGESGKDVKKIKKLAIDEKKAAGHSLFKIARLSKFLICVSDALASLIEKGAFQGIKFDSPENWSRF